MLLELLTWIDSNVMPVLALLSFPVVLILLNKFKP